MAHNLSFENDDYLNNKHIAIEIAGKIKNIKKSSFYAIDEPIGYGKSYFLEMFKTFLKNKDKYIYIFYDAKEYDYYDKPIIPLLSSIISRNDYINFLLEEEKLNSKLKEFKANLELIAKEIFREKLKQKIGDNASTIVDNKFKGINNTLLMEKLDQLCQTKDLYQILLENLKFLIDLADTFEKRFVFIIDGLDCCNPAFAFKTIYTFEKMKAIKGLSLVAAIDGYKLLNDITRIENLDNANHYISLFNYNYKLVNAENKESFIMKHLQKNKTYVKLAKEIYLEESGEEVIDGYYFSYIESNISSCVLFFKMNLTETSKMLHIYNKIIKKYLRYSTAYFHHEGYAFLLAMRLSNFSIYSALFLNTNLLGYDFEKFKRIMNKKEKIYNSLSETFGLCKSIYGHTDNKRAFCFDGHIESIYRYDKLLEIKFRVDDIKYLKNYESGGFVTYFHFEFVEEGVFPLIKLNLYKSDLSNFISYYDLLNWGEVRNHTLEEVLVERIEEIIKSD